MVEDNKRAARIYDKDELIRALQILLTDDDLYKEFRKNAIELASKYDWEDVFNNAFLSSSKLTSRTLRSMK